MLPVGKCDKEGSVITCVVRFSCLSVCVLCVSDVFCGELCFSLHFTVTLLIKIVKHYRSLYLLCILVVF